MVECTLYQKILDAKQQTILTHGKCVYDNKMVVCKDKDFKNCRQYNYYNDIKVYGGIMLKTMKRFNFEGSEVSGLEKMLE